MRTLCTIGFTKKNLPEFVTLLRDAGVTKLLDVRLRNTSQLAGYAKKDDLAFVLNLCGIDYEHVTEFAPTAELLDSYKREKDWQRFEEGFSAVLKERDPVERFEETLDRHSAICLLCSEDKAERCHRRLVAEYIANRLPGMRVVHL